MLRTSVLCLVVVTLLGTRLAAADSPEPKNPETAAMLSLSGTLGSGALIVLGLANHGGAGDSLALVGFASSVITPSFGEWYAGEYLTAGLGFRLTGVIVGALGLSQLNICFESPCNSDGNGAALTLMSLGVVSYATGVIWDIAAAPSAARKANAMHHAPMITPSVMASPSGRAAYGLGVGGTF